MNISLIINLKSFSEGNLLFPQSATRPDQHQGPIVNILYPGILVLWYKKMDWRKVRYHRIMRWREVIYICEGLLYYNNKTKYSWLSGIITSLIKLLLIIITLSWVIFSRNIQIQNTCILKQNLSKKNIAWWCFVCFVWVMGFCFTNSLKSLSTWTSVKNF